MRAVVLAEYGKSEVLRIREIPDLAPGAGEVRVKVHATALNRADIMQREGNYPPPDPKPEHEIPGLEFSGIVDALGPDTSGAAHGDRVCGLLPGGGYAEQVVLQERMLIPMPGEMSFHVGASLPEVYLTAWDALTTRGGFAAGNDVLIHAGGSGVGTAAIQLARILGARRVFATTRTAEKIAKMITVGADRAIDVGKEKFEEIVLEETGGKGVEVVVDSIGAPYLSANLEAVAAWGTIVFLAAQGGTRTEFSIGQLLKKKARMVGTSLRVRSLEAKIDLTRRFRREILPRFASGELHPVIDRSFPFEEVAAAHDYMESNANFGKIVLTIRT
jgi:putative PIG3 family NAD(P)H quinone oxidoreductase